jgi:high-affinity nickel-transport protein
LPRRDVGEADDAERVGLTGQPWRFVPGLDLNSVGYVLAAMFLVARLAAVAVWRLGRIEEKWSARPRPSALATELGYATRGSDVAP